MHRRERLKPTSSVHLASLALTNFEVRVHGFDQQRVDLSDEVTPERRVWALVHDPNALILSKELVDADLRPVTLLVPDGSWRQASKLARRIPRMAQAQRVTLPEGPSSRYQIRHEPKAGGLATMEAIARALGFLEGAQVQASLEALFDEMVRRTLDSRQPPPNGSTATCS